MRSLVPLEWIAVDNLTHSLIGAGVAEAAGKRSAARPWYYFASILANNAPDSDVFIPLFIHGDRKVTSLLNHRGHTHTYFGSLILSLLCYGIVLGVARLLGKRFNKTEKRWIFGLSLLGNILHILADSFNSYGVHPYWPLDASWHYGDFIFIVEPWIWLALAPALFFAAKTRVAKTFFAGVLVLLVGIAWRVPLLNLPARIAIFAATFLLPLIYRQIAANKRIFAAFGMLGFILLVFAGAKVFVKNEIAKLHENFYDAAISPLPGNPFCWSAFLLSSTSDDYRIKIATLAPFAHVMHADRCPSIGITDTTAPLKKVSMPNSENIVWHGEFRGKLQDLRLLADKSCRARAVFRFMRMPFWLKINENEWILGDLRFDRSKAVGFTEFLIDLREGNKCPPGVPGWTAPLAPLLPNPP